MAKTQDEILSAALHLPSEARAAIAECLFRSLDECEQGRIDAVWAVEIERRITRLDSGEVQPIPGGEVMAKLWDRLK